MSNLVHNEDVEPDPEEDRSGPNLLLMYALLAFGILAAMAFAAMVVWPFYARR